MAISTAIRLHWLYLGLALITASVAFQYTGLTTLQCFKSDFVKAYTGVQSERLCASLCDVAPDCQAFSMADGPCRLFVFNRCSKYVRNCTCTHRAQVFVKQQPGLPPGAMCPSGFKDDLCGTKYKLYGGFTDWNVAKAALDAEPGLVIMADVVDNTEMTQVHSIAVRVSLSYFMLGGMQAPGSAEPAGGWYWVSCNTSISSGLWTSGQPDNGGGAQSYAATGKNFAKLDDGTLTSGYGALGECVSPFD